MTEHLKLSGGDPDQPQKGTGLLADYVQSRLPPAACAYWTALQPNLPVEWCDGYSKSLGLLCGLLAECDELRDAIDRTSEGETGLMSGQNGESRKHPLYTRLNQSEVQIHELMNRFGMSPLSLKRVKATNNRDDNDLLTIGSLLG